MPRISVQNLCTIVHGDARATGLPDGHFHCVATSPPYFGLREYGDDDREIGNEPSPDEYIAEMIKVGREVRRVLRNDGVWWLNLGDSYGPNKSLFMIPQQVAIALQRDGWIVRSQIPWIKANAMPESVRDRPTVAHEYVFLLTKSSGYFWDAEAVRDAESGRNIRTSDFIRMGLDDGGLVVSTEGDPLCFAVNSASSKLAHFAMWPPRLVAPMIKVSTSQKGCCPHCGAQWMRSIEKGELLPPKSRPDVVQCQGNGETTQHQKGRAKACFSRARIDKGFRKACSCPNHTPVPCRVLDPFAGSGTTMQVCEALGRDSWGVELMTKNIPIIETRLAEKLDPETMRPIVMKKR